MMRDEHGPLGRALTVALLQEGASSKDAIIASAARMAQGAQVEAPPPPTAGAPLRAAAPPPPSLILKRKRSASTASADRIENADSVVDGYSGDRVRVQVRPVCVCAGGTGQTRALYARTYAYGALLPALLLPSCLRSGMRWSVWASSSQTLASHASGSLATSSQLRRHCLLLQTAERPSCSWADGTAERPSRAAAAAAGGRPSSTGGSTASGPVLWRFGWEAALRRLRDQAVAFQCRCMLRDRGAADRGHRQRCSVGCCGDSRTLGYTGTQSVGRHDQWMNAGVPPTLLPGAALWTCALNVSASKPSSCSSVLACRPKVRHPAVQRSVPAA